MITRLAAMIRFKTPPSLLLALHWAHTAAQASRHHTPRVQVVQKVRSRRVSHRSTSRRRPSSSVSLMALGRSRRMQG
ncbi:hypothetical protein FB45DRAFT_940060 [Roridomyces roridus]|uniref:Secreted protein n=1 Tax=Roridomyces roridus TaxID=1738132 RepID=A0AAD7FAG0_9AGAR|nr:hypothetical protein FB45DRAFT_940060 [Roridomyces roridus]